MKRLIILLLLSPTLAVATSNVTCIFGTPCEPITSGSGTITTSAVTFATDVISGTVDFPPFSNGSGLGMADSFAPAREFVLMGQGVEPPNCSVPACTLAVNYSADFPAGLITHPGSWSAPFVFDALSAPAEGSTVSAHGDGTVVIHVLQTNTNMLFADSGTFTFGAAAPAPEPSTASLLLIALLAGLAIAVGRRTLMVRALVRSARGERHSSAA
jgi:hypothetical protein